MDTLLSSKGQVVIPKTLRDQLNWRPGERLDIGVENGRVYLSAESALPTRDIAEVAGCLHRPGRKAHSLEEMEKAILAAARTNHDRA